ncbi:hypothetical protein KDA_35970 [Dictyobacter alpinus]|uniref:Uncharacterized protein n=1 Tax=Dictyobacter alpinus TaxID=2014873 RepID=A0A402B9N5_9CHLR|nr:hypothetical protein KDA_35970 [Dictyobacter alpinus]
MSGISPDQRDAHTGGNDSAARSPSRSERLTHFPNTLLKMSIPVQFIRRFNESDKGLLDKIEESIQED